MKLIELDASLTSETFAKLETEWNNLSDVGLLIASDVSSRQGDLILALALKRLPSGFAFGVMGCLAEIDNVSEDALKIIFQQGDIACKEAVCLRHHKSQEIIDLCKTYKAQHV